MGWARWAVTFERLPCSLMKSRKRTRSATQRRSPRERALPENQRTARVRSTKHVAMERSREGAEDSGGMPPNDSDLRRLPPDDEQSRHPRTAARVAEYIC